MGFRINTNIAALQAHTSSVMNNKNLDNSLSRLSSGLRINKAADDASGMAIADSLRSQAQGLGQAINNANDGVAVVQTADGALDEYIGIINTVRTKAIQAASDGQNSDSREAIQADIDRLLEAANSIANTTQFNGQKLLDGTFTNKDFHIGAYAGETVSLSAGNVQTNSVGDIKAVQTASTRDATVIADNLTETTSGYQLQSDQLKINGVDISSVLNTQAPNSLTSAKSVASAITSATGILAQATTQLSGTAVTGGTLAEGDLQINGVNVAATEVSANDADGALTAAINAISGRTGVTASLVAADDSGNKKLVLESKDGSNISVGGNESVSAARVETINLPAGETNAEAGDNYAIAVSDGTNTFTINHTVTESGGTPQTMAAVFGDLKTALEGNSDIAALVDVSIDGTTGALVLTGKTDTTVFSSTVTVSDMSNVDTSSAITASGESSDQLAAQDAIYNSGTLMVADRTATLAANQGITWADGLGNSFTVQAGTSGNDFNPDSTTLDAAMTLLAGKINASADYSASYTAADGLVVDPASNTLAASFIPTLTDIGAGIGFEQTDGTGVKAGVDYSAGSLATATAAIVNTNMQVETVTATIADLAGDAGAGDYTFDIGGLTVAVTLGGASPADDVDGADIAALLNGISAGDVVNSATNAFGASNVSITGTADWNMTAAAAVVTGTSTGFTNYADDAFADNTEAMLTVATTQQGVGVDVGDTVAWTNGTDTFTYTVVASDLNNPTGSGYADTYDAIMGGLAREIDTDAGAEYNATWSGGDFTVTSNTAGEKTTWAPNITLTNVGGSTGAITDTLDGNETNGTNPVTADAAAYTSFKLEPGTAFAAGTVLTWSDGATANTVNATYTVGANDSFNDAMEGLAAAITADATAGAATTYTASFDTATGLLQVDGDDEVNVAGFNPTLSASVANTFANIENTGYSTAGTTGTNATGTFALSGVATNVDSGDDVSITLSDGTLSATFSYTTEAGDGQDEILAGLRAVIAADAGGDAAALFGGNGITTDAYTNGDNQLSFTANGATGQALTITNSSAADSGVIDNADITPAVTTATATIGSYEIAGLSDYLTNASSSAAVAALAASETDALTLLEGELVINGKDMAGIYGNGINAGSAADDFIAAIQSIDGMEDSNMTATGTINLIVNNGNDLNIAGVKATDTFKLTEGVFNESQSGKVSIFTNDNLEISGSDTALFGFTTGNFTPTSADVSLESIDVTSRDSAEVAILIADSALKQLDSTRADLGSVQNQLESTIRNISVTAVNVTAAESQIRDVDFAQESANFSKFNILAQSGTYAMSQANAVQQNVLRLLQ